MSPEYGAILLADGYKTLKLVMRISFTKEIYQVLRETSSQAYAVVNHNRKQM